MRCAFCERDFTPKRTTGKYCSTKCRCAAWQANREHALDRLAEQAERVAAGLRALRDRD